MRKLCALNTFPIGGEIKTWKNRYFILSKGNLSYYEKQYVCDPSLSPYSSFVCLILQ